MTMPMITHVHQPYNVVSFIPFASEATEKDFSQMARNTANAIKADIPRAIENANIISSMGSMMGGMSTHDFLSKGAML